MIPMLILITTINKNDKSVIGSNLLYAIATIIKIAAKANTKKLKNDITLPAIILPTDLVFLSFVLFTLSSIILCSTISEGKPNSGSTSYLFNIEGFFLNSFL